MKQFSKIWFIWLILVCIWNFGWPNVKPLYDVIVAIILSIGAYQLKKYYEKTFFCYLIISNNF